jgi:hypothetical protein
VLGVDEAKVRFYVPLALEFGGLIFLAFGFAPRRRNIAIEPVEIATEAPVVATEV